MKKRIHKLVVQVEQYGEGVFRTSLEIKGDTDVLSEAIAHEIIDNETGGILLTAIINDALEHLDGHDDEEEPEEEEKTRIIN